MRIERVIVIWPSSPDWPPASHHDSSNVFGIVSVQVELEGHHLVIVRLQLTLHHPVHFIRELQRQTGSAVLTGFCLLSKPASKAEHKWDDMFLCVSKDEDTSLVPLEATCCVLHVWVYALVALLFFLYLSIISAKLTCSLKKEPNGRCLWHKACFGAFVPLWCAALIAPSFWTTSQRSAWRPFSRSSLTDPRSHHSNPRLRRRHNCKDTWGFFRKCDTENHL